MKNPREILSAYFGHEDFKPAQKEVIDAILDQNNVLALLPTGGGKSLCFQIPALAKEGICIVVSPLIALMQDQVNTLKAKGIKAMLLESGIPFRELDSLLDNCIYGNYKFLYLSPERLQQEIVLARIEQMDVNLIAVDEAHCISQWGHDFRPAYRKIPVLKKLKPSVPWIALTATATQKVREDILSLLEMESALVVKKSFERENISFQSEQQEDKRYYLHRFLRENPGSSIVYVRSRRESMELSNYLTQHDLSASAYHGGISSEDKKKKLIAWLDGEIRVMVATNAFGMGIDKPDVRSVIHYHLPESLESYFQEAGRAGRDGKPAIAIILYNKADPDRVKTQFLSVLPDVKFVKQVYRKLQSFFAIAYGEGENTKHDFNFSEFCQTYELPPIKTHNTLQILDRASILMLSKQYRKNIELQFLVSNAQLLYFLENNRKHEHLVKTLLRTYPGIFDYSTAIDLSLIKSKTNLSENNIFHALAALEHEEIISLSIAKHDANISFLVPREDEQTINPLSKYIVQQQRRKVAQVSAVLDYVMNDTLCKNRQLLTYFGEKEHGNCGICSVCLQKKSKQKKNNPKTIQESILNQLENGPLTSREIIENVGFPSKEVLSVLQILVEYDLVILTDDNKYISSQKPTFSK